MMLKKRNILNNETYSEMIYLINLALNKQKTDSIENDVDLFNLCKSQRLASLVGSAFNNPKPYWTKAIIKAVRRDILFNTQREEILKLFEKNNIKYCLLKGLKMKDCYPNGAYREMSDNDILVEEKDLIKINEIMLSLDFTCEELGGVRHDAYQKDPIYNFEFHKSLFDERDIKEIKEYFSSITNRVIQDKENKHEYHLSKEEFYLHLFCHAYGHYIHNGVGIRHLIDFYLYTKNNDLDWVFIKDSLNKMNLVEQEELFRNTAYKLFDNNDELNKEELHLLELMFVSGTNGSSKGSVIQQLKKNTNEKGKVNLFKYIHSRLFLDEMYLKKSYPFFYKHKWARPFLTIYRLIHGLFKNTKKILWEIKTLFNKTK